MQHQISQKSIRYNTKHGTKLGNYENKPVFFGSPCNQFLPQSAEVGHFLPCSPCVS